MLTISVQISCICIQPTCVWRNQLQEKTNKHQGMKCEMSEDSWGLEKSPENAEKGNIHGRMCAAMQFSWWPVSPGLLHMYHHLITHRPAWTPSGCIPPPAAAAAAGAATLQNEPPPHISAQVRAHSWVLDTDLTRGPSEAWVVAWQDDGRPACRSELFCCLTGRLLTVLRSSQTDEAECAAGKRSWTLEAGLMGKLACLIVSIFRVRWNEFVAATWGDLSLEMQWECGDWITSFHTATTNCQLSSAFFK